MNLEIDSIHNMNQFLKNNTGINFRTLNLQNTQEVDNLSFLTLEPQKKEILAQLKVFQRLLRILPECDRQYEIVKVLITKNITSAIQIASIPRQHFMKEYGDIFGDNNLLETIYTNATAVKTQVLLNYMNIKQNTEAYINATLFHK